MELVVKFNILIGFNIPELRSISVHVDALRRIFIRACGDVPDIEGLSAIYVVLYFLEKPRRKRSIQIKSMAGEKAICAEVDVVISPDLISSSGFFGSLSVVWPTVLRAIKLKLSALGISDSIVEQIVSALRFPDRLGDEGIEVA